MRSITTTDSRLVNALKNATNKGLETRTGNNTIKQNLEVSNVDLTTGTVTKWYKGIDKAVVLVDGVEVEAFLNYPFVDNDLIVSIVPDGQSKTDENGTYIIPTHNVLCNILKYKHHSSTDYQYCILGFKQGESTKTSFMGEILLQAGNNQINISKEFINIKANMLFVNGVKYDQSES